MKLRWGMVLGLLLLATPVFAQFTTDSRWEWSAPADALDIADAQSATYKVYLDGATTGVVLTGVTCGPPKPGHTVATCTAPLAAALLPVVNKRKLSAALTATAADGTPESPQSVPFVVSRGLGAPALFGLVP